MKQQGVLQRTQRVEQTLLILNLDAIHAKILKLVA